MRCEPAHSIIERLGGAPAVAKILGISSHAVNRWRRVSKKSGMKASGAVPAWYMKPLVESPAGIAAGLTYADFIYDPTRNNEILETQVSEIFDAWSAACDEAKDEFLKRAGLQRA